MSAIALVAALGAAMGSSNLIWLGALWLWPTLLGFALVLVGNLGWGQLRNLLPLTGPGLLPVAAQVVPLTSHFGELVYLAVLSSYLATPSRLVRAAAYVTLGTAVTWMLVTLVYLMVFPLPGGLGVPFPLFDMTRLVQGGRFFERVDAFWITFWTAGCAVRGAAALHAAALLLRDAFRLPNHRGAVLPLVIATVSLALFPTDQAGAIAAETFLLRRWGFLAMLVLPLCVALLARARGAGAGTGGGGHG